MSRYPYLYDEQQMEIIMKTVNKIIKQAESECKCIWLSAERIDSQLADIRHAFDGQHDLSADQIAKLKVLESTLINKKPGWQ